MKAAQAKKEKEAAKKVLKRERKQFRTLCKTHNYYVGKSGGGEGEVVAGRLQELEALCESLSLEQLAALNERLRGGREEEGRAAVEEAVSLWSWVKQSCVCHCHWAVSDAAGGEEREGRGRACCSGQG